MTDNNSAISARKTWTRRASPSPRRAIIAHPMNLGDVVTTLPLAGALKKRWPGLEIYFCGISYARPLIECCSHIDGFIDADTLLKHPETLRSLNADIIFNPYPAYTLMRPARQARIPIRIGNLRRPRTWFYCNRFVTYSRKHSADHTVDIVLKNLRAMGLRTRIIHEDLGTIYGLTRLEPLAEELAALLEPARFNLILHPKSGGEGREWPIEHFSALASMLPAERCRIFITGVEQEGVAMRREAPELFIRENVVDLTGRLTLKQFIALTASADGMVASGTGPLHIAAALGIHALGIYPPLENINRLRWAPIGPKAESIGRHECPRDKQRSCRLTPLGPPCACMQAVLPCEALDVLKRWMDHSLMDRPSHPA